MMHWHWDKLGCPRLTVLIQSTSNPIPEENEVGPEQKYAMKIFLGRDTSPSTIEYKSPEKSTKSLGMFSNPRGTREVEAQKLRKKLYSCDQNDVP